MIASACSVAIKCEPCTKEHVKRALNAGIKMEEILEAISVAGLICCGSGFASAEEALEEMKG